jgi:hypothetical protein
MSNAFKDRLLQLAIDEKPNHGLDVMRRLGDEFGPALRIVT